MPFGRTHAVTDMNIGILFMLGVSSLGVLGIIMAGWASNSHYPLMGSLRSSAQMVSYEIAMGLAVISRGPDDQPADVARGTLSMIGIVEAQAAQHIWFIFKFFPLGFIAFVVFAIAMVAETNRAPFDLPEAESELVAGFHTEYSGFRWSLFFLARVRGHAGGSSIAVTLWLGGWMRPFPNWLSGRPGTRLSRFVPGADVLRVCRRCACSARCACRRFRSSGFRHWARSFRSCCCGLVGLVLLVPAVRERVQDIFWLSPKLRSLCTCTSGTAERFRAIASISS